jgi:hypothetical protein
MNLPETQYGPQAGVGIGPADPDVLLRSFFQAEMPAPWPKLTPTISISLPRRRSLPRSRLALAASLGLLFVGNYWLFRSFHGTDTSETGLAVPVLEATDWEHKSKLPIPKRFQDNLTTKKAEIPLQP